MKKKHILLLVTAVLLLSLVGFPASAANGMMSGEKNIQVVKTQWFDIIYPPDSQRTAALLAKNADRIYTEVADFFGVQPWFRLPVVISPASDEFNGGFTFYPYNRIVLYDAVPQENLAVFSQTILSDFRHELSHAVTYNMKNKFWRSFDRVMGDLYNPALLYVTTAFAEGASVTSESSQGEGRLNSEYNKQMVKQAKIEGLFPANADIQGAKDVYPDGYESYRFGAAFAQWLQNKYGMEKYAQYWYRAVNLKGLTYYTLFKKVYGIKIKDAWQQFKESVKVPDISANPLQTAGYTDLFTHLGITAGPETFTKNNSQGSLYYSLTAGKNCIAWIDETSDIVWYSSVIDGSYSQPVKLFSLDNISQINLSADGKYLAVSYYSEAHATVKSKVKIYDITKKRWFTVPGTGLRDATVIVTDDAYMLAAVKTHSQYADIALSPIVLKNNKIAGIGTATTIPSTFGDTPFSLTDSGNDTLSYIYKKGLVWSIRQYNIKDGSVTEYKTPADHAVLRYLSCAGSDSSKTELLFSYTVPGSMPRLGQLHIAENTATYSLQQTNVSGGIYFPVTFENKIAYTGEFYRDFRLLALDTGKIQFAESTAAVQNISADSAATDKIQAEKDIKEQLASAKKYNPLDYYKKGIVFPFAATCSEKIESGSLTASGFPLGLTYVTSNPWGGKIIELSAAYDPLSNSGLGLCALQGGTDTSLFSYLVQGQAEFDSRGYKQSLTAAQVSFSIPVGMKSDFVFSDTADFFEGRQNKTDISFDTIKNIFDYIGLHENTDMTAHIYGSNSLSAELSNLHSSGPGSYEKTGGYILTSYDTVYTSEASETFDSDNIYQNLSLEAYGQVSKLIPVLCRYGTTYNLPTGFDLNLFPSSSYFITGNAETVLYSKELQKGIPFFAALYFNRITFKAGYTGKFSYGTADSWDFLKTPDLVQNLFTGGMQYYDSINLKTVLAFTPNIGTFATSSCQFDITATLLYRIRPETGYNHIGVSLCGQIVF